MTLDSIGFRWNVTIFPSGKKRTATLTIHNRRSYFMNDYINSITCESYRNKSKFNTNISERRLTTLHITSLTPPQTHWQIILIEMLRLFQWFIIAKYFTSLQTYIPLPFQYDVFHNVFMYIIPCVCHNNSWFISKFFFSTPVVW